MYYMWGPFRRLIFFPNLYQYLICGYTYLLNYLLYYLLTYLHTYLLTFFSVALRPNAGHYLLILEVSRSHTTTHHSR